MRFVPKIQLRLDCKGVAGAETLDLLRNFLLRHEGLREVEVVVIHWRELCIAHLFLYFLHLKCMTRTVQKKVSLSVEFWDDEDQ